MNQEIGDTSIIQLDIEHIIREIQDGQTDQFQWLVKEYQSRIYLYCHRMLGNHHEAEEAVQEVFIKSYQHLKQYTDHISFAAWLYKIAYHHCINLLKRRSSWLQVLRFYQIQQSDKSSYKPIDSGAGTELLAKLSPEERSLILLRAIDEYSYEEIAQIINKKAATVRKRYERAKKKLKAMYIEGEAPYET
jgi:RNA polymerase sigma-70 factor, ECF subfamily